jgi:hypothetical protein
LQRGFDPNPIITDIGRDAGDQAGYRDFEDLADLQHFGHGGVGYPALEPRNGLSLNL